MREPTNTPGATRRSRRFSTTTILLVLVLASALLVAGCGDPLALRSLIENLVLLDQYGGAAARLFVTEGNDRFFGALDFFGTLHVVGSTSTQQTRNDGLLMRIDDRGGIVNELEFVDETLGTHYDETFTSIGAAYLGGGDADRVIVAGHRTLDDGSSTSEALIFQFRITSGGPEPTKIARFGSVGGNEYIHDLHVGAASFAVVGESDATGSVNSFYAIIGDADPEGDPRDMAFLSETIENRLHGVSEYDEGATPTFIMAGEYDHGSFGTDLMLAAVRAGDGDILPADTATVIDAGGDARDYGFDIAQIGNTNRFVVVGGTQAYFGGTDAWLVIVVNWDDGSNQFSLERAWAILPIDYYDGYARSVLAVDPTENYWGQEDLFVIGGDANTAALMNANGEIVWAVGRSGGSELVLGRIEGIATNDGTSEGFFFAGWQDENPERPRLDDAFIEWVFPETGESFPETADLSGSLEKLDITLNVNLTTVTVSSITDAPGPGNIVATVIDVADYPRTRRDNFEVFTN